MNLTKAKVIVMLLVFTSIVGALGVIFGYHKAKVEAGPQHSKMLGCHLESRGLFGEQRFSCVAAWISEDTSQDIFCVNMTKKEDEEQSLATLSKAIEQFCPEGKLYTPVR